MAPVFYTASFSGQFALARAERALAVPHWFYVRYAAHGFDVELMQSNHEGVLVDEIQRARTRGAAIIINPAAYTHTSVALHDALEAAELPVVEVHLSNVHRREEFRHHSFVSPQATAVIAGAGAYGYVMAVDFLAQHLSD